MILSKENLRDINLIDIVKPDAQIFDLPNKVLQFGTGVLLRGLPDYFIDKANRRGLFNGRVIVIKSTNAGDTLAFEIQNGLFTQLIGGIDDGKIIEEIIINSSISSILAAREDWDKILDCAADPNIQLIISNTTEVGISFIKEDKIYDCPPSSYPGKLLSILWQRYNISHGHSDNGFVIIPTELIVDNGEKLKAIVVELAKLNGLDDAFLDWLSSANDFCNSLVDRIVPGKLPSWKQKEMEKKLGYDDDLMIMSESYRLWAIESSNTKTIDILSPLIEADKGLSVVPDIEKFRELKLRLLNGSHTFSCSLAIQAGFNTVKEAMHNEGFKNFITTLMMNEISPSICNEEITLDEAKAFASEVLNRYQNPFLEHDWLAISAQYTSKMKMRNVPTIINSFDKHGSCNLMATCFAGYILFMRSELNSKGQYIRFRNGEEHVILDDYAANLYKKWKENSPDTISYSILKDETLWGLDLSKPKGFADMVQKCLESLMNKGVSATLSEFAQQNMS